MEELAHHGQALNVFYSAGLVHSVVAAHPNHVHFRVDPRADKSLEGGLEQQTREVPAVVRQGQRGIGPVQPMHDQFEATTGVEDRGPRFAVCIVLGASRLITDVRPRRRHKIEIAHR